MPNFASNRVRRGRPDKGLRAVVALTYVISNRSYQLTDAAEGSSPDAFVGDFREEAFHQIQPGSAGGSEMPVITGVLGKPSLHLGMGMGAIVIEDEVNRQLARGAALDAVQKAQKLLMAVARHAVSQNLAVQHVQRREQGRGSMALVIMGLPFGDSWAQRQNRLGAIQSLNLALFVHAQHQGLLWRVQV